MEDLLTKECLLANGYEWYPLPNDSQDRGTCVKEHLKIEFQSRYKIRISYQNGWGVDGPQLAVTTEDKRISQFNKILKCLIPFEAHKYTVKGGVVDNFDAFIDIMHFENKNEFYFIQILMRRKDGHHEPGINGDNSSNRLIKFYTIHSIEELEQKKDEIIKLCQIFNARAYIHPSRRNDNEIADQVLQLTTDMYLEKTYRHRMKCIYTRACGLTPTKYDKMWVVDIDIKDMEEVERLKALINKCRPEGDKIVITLPTRNGYHLLTRPFDLKMFKDNGGNDIDVHKNNPTLLYYEEPLRYED